MGFRGVDVEGVTLGDSPNAETMLRGMPDFSASTGSLGSGKKRILCPYRYKTNLGLGAKYFGQVLTILDWSRNDFSLLNFGL